MTVRRLLSCVLSMALACGLPIMAQTPIGVEPFRPTQSIFLRNYLPVQVPAIRLANSTRFGSLLRAGNLYLTVQDAIALALENNIDIEVARYDHTVAEWNLERAQAGGALPGVPSGASAASSVANGQGVAGSQAAAGVSATAGSGGPGGSNSTIAQIGPTTQTLDPILQGSAVFAHKTTPEYDSVQSVTSVLISDSRVYSSSYQQGFLAGGSVTVGYTEHYLNENAASDVLNPSVAPSLSLSFQQNFLRGFGTAVGGRTIDVRRMNIGISDLNFRTTVDSSIVNVLNAYYALAGDDEALKAKQAALTAARDFLNDNRKRVELGALAPLDVTAADSQLATAEQDVILAETSFRQQELALKNLLSRTGVADPLLASARIVPLDRLAIPDHEAIPPVADLVKKALATRTDLAAEKANITTAEISALGTKNGVLPTLIGFGGTSQAGLAGTSHNVFGVSANPYFAGGLGTAVGQAFRRDFPTERIGVYAQANVYNRQAQADYGVEQLSLRQQQLSTQKDLNQVQVDVTNAVIALQQSRSRYEAAVYSRILQEKLLDAERKKFDLGASTPYNVVTMQRDLATSQSTELAALVSYSNARVSLDQTTGSTLENNHVSIEQARTGHVTSQPGSN
jgi:outer membrane protein